MQTVGWTACAVMLTVASIADTRTGRIPNLVVLAGAVSACLVSAMPLGTGLAQALLGMLAGLLLFMPFYIFRLLGAGDVKLLAAVGTFTGFPDILYVALVAGLCGGFIALKLLVRKKRTKLPFAIAISAGTLVFSLIGIILT